MHSAKTTQLAKSLLHAAVFGSCALSSASALDVLTVDSAGPFTTIQAAVLASTAEDVILVSPGTYTEEVRVVGGGRTIIARHDCFIDGSIEFRGVPADEAVLLAGLDVTPPDGTFPGSTVRSGALHFEDCAGPVRVVDCVITGQIEGFDSGAYLTAAEGGPGILAIDCRDVALIDSTVTGGRGAHGFAFSGFGGPGGDGLYLDNIRRATVMRSLVFGGHGHVGDNGGRGGDGIQVLGATTLHLDYSLCQGGNGFDSSSFTSDRGGDGGHGLVAELQTIWDFQSIFVGGDFGIATNSPPGPSVDDGTPGQGIVGGSSIRLLEGHPSRLEIPLIVQEGDVYERRVAAVSGERILYEISSRAGFGFSRRLVQARLIGAQPLSPVATLGPIVSTTQFGSFAESVTAPLLRPGSDVLIEWRSALCLDGFGNARRTSTRPLIVLRSGL